MTRLARFGEVIETFDLRCQEFRSATSQSRERKQLNMAKWTWFAAICVIVGAIFLGYDPSLLWDGIYKPDKASFQTAVALKVPIGSSISDAQLSMESKGFHCTMDHDERYSSPGGALKRGDILVCIGSHTVMYLIEKDWIAIFLDNGGKVAEVSVNVYLTGS